MKSRMDKIEELALELYYEARLLSINTDLLKELVLNEYFDTRGPEPSFIDTKFCEVTGRSYKEVEGPVQVSWFVYILKVSDAQYQYRAECLLDELREMA